MSAVRRLLDEGIALAGGEASSVVVLHLAAVVGGIGANRAHPGRFFYENAVMGTHLIHEAWQYGVQKLVVIGTVMLAEVGELPARLQEALLRLLERHELRRLHSTTPVPARARVIASTCVDLRSRISAGLFREDLYQQLSAEKLDLPSLRERPDDIPTLARHFLERCCGHLPHGPRDFTPEAEAVLRGYSWPENLRELREVVEDAAVRARGERIGVEDLAERLRGEQRGGPLPSLREVEIRHIERVLQEARGNQRRASRILGISRWSLSRRLRKYGLQPRSEQ